jgi:hypothetical protein
VTADQIDAARRLLATPESGAVKGKRLAPAAGDGLIWREIQADGGESLRRGPVWSTAPPVKGRRAWFAHDLGTGLIVRVCLASRRHQVGRRIEGRWRPAGGRFVDVGTLYTETDPSSLSGAALRPLARRRARALPAHVMALLSGEYGAAESNPYAPPAD